MEAGRVCWLLIWGEANEPAHYRSYSVGANDEIISSCMAVREGDEASFEISLLALDLQISPSLMNT